jgi:hypothetical protein
MNIAPAGGWRLAPYAARALVVINDPEIGAEMAVSEVAPVQEEEEPPV